MRWTGRWIAAAVVIALAVAGFGWHSWTHRDTKGNAQLSGSKTRQAKLAAQNHDRAGVATGGDNDADKKPLPAPGTPLKQVLSELESRAYAGDAEAASRLYNDLSACARTQIANRTAPAIAAQVLSETTAPVSSAATQTTNARLNDLQHKLDFARDNATLCAGIDASDIARLVPDTLQAARLGDTLAADCYVFADLNSWFSFGMADNPQWISGYKENALDVANTAVQHGDWAMVNLLDWAYRGGASTRGLLPQVTGLNLAQAYAYEKLWALGHPSNAEYATAQAQYLANYAAQMKLNPAEMQTAETQAQEMYQKYFGSTPAQGVARDPSQACRVDVL